MTWFCLVLRCHGILNPTQNLVETAHTTHRKVDDTAGLLIIVRTHTILPFKGKTKEAALSAFHATFKLSVVAPEEVKFMKVRAFLFIRPPAQGCMTM